MSKKLAIGAIVGAIAGLAAGVLTAPKSGRETRDDIKKKAEEMKDKAKLLFTHARIDEPSKWIEKILCMHNVNSSFTENDFFHLLDLQS